MPKGLRDIAYMRRHPRKSGPRDTGRRYTRKRQRCLVCARSLTSDNCFRGLLPLGPPKPSSRFFAAPLTKPNMPSISMTYLWRSGMRMPICCRHVQKRLPDKANTKYGDARTPTPREHRNAIASTPAGFVSTTLQQRNGTTLTPGRCNPCQTRNAPLIAPAALGERLVLKRSKSN